MSDNKLETLADQIAYIMSDNELTLAEAVGLLELIKQDIIYEATWSDSEVEL